MKKVLIFGGTQFIGRNLIERLLENEELDITLFNRGKTNPDLFPAIDKIKGDRNSKDIEKLKGTKWDFVIDVSCYFPDSLEHILSVVNPDLLKYIFISTCSVYDPKVEVKNRDEYSTILNCTKEERTDTSWASYGQRKAECERILARSGFNHLILRPPLVYGPHDHTDRFYYWVHQIQTQKEILIPENGHNLFSTAFVKDLIDVIEHGLVNPYFKGTFNSVSYPQTSIRQIVEKASELLERTPKLVNANADFLKENNVKQWTDFPLWINNDYFTFSNSNLLDKLPFTLTSFEESLRHTIHYYKGLNWPEPEYGLSLARQKVLINLLK